MVAAAMEECAGGGGVGRNDGHEFVLIFLFSLIFRLVKNKV